MAQPRQKEIAMSEQQTFKQTKVLALLVGRDDGFVQPYYGIEHEGKLWLVTAWIVNRSTQEATPERMIRVDALNPRPLKCDPNEKFDYENVLLPKAVIEGISQDTHGFEVRSLPDAPIVHRRDLKPLPSLFS
jgi:hypothetical protein